MENSVLSSLPVLLFVLCAIGLAIGLLIVANLFNPGRPSQVERMPYESGMDPIHDTRRRFDVRFYLLAIAFLIFDVELLFLYPWAVMAGRAENKVLSTEYAVRSTDREVQSAKHETSLAKDESEQAGNFPNSVLSTQYSVLSTHSAHRLAFAGAMSFLALLTVGYIYDWRKGVFRWR